MGESCTPECAVQLAQLSGRVTELEEADKRHMEFRKEYYKDREARIYRDAQLDMKISNIDTSLAKVVSWTEAQQIKPAKRMDIVAEKVLTTLAGALGTLLLGALAYGLSQLG